LRRYFGERIGWPSDGCICQKWDDEILPIIIRIQDDNHGFIYKGKKKQLSCTVELWMIELDGQIQQARPTIVARCESLQIAKKTVWLFERIHHFVDMDLGFDLLPWKDLIPSVHCLSGSRIRIETNNLGLPLNEATLGGFLVVDGKFCGLTVAHPFLDTRQESTAVLDGSDSDDESDWQEDFDRFQKDKVSNSETPSPLFVNRSTNQVWTTIPRSRRQAFQAPLHTSTRPKVTGF
jgi:hypothetical protein